MEDTAALLNHTNRLDVSPERNEPTSHRLDFKALCKNRYLALASVLATAGGTLFGYDLGVVSGVILQLKPQFMLTCFQQEMIISSMLIGAIFTSIFAGWIIDILGRRITIIMSAILYGVGAILASLSNSYGLLVCARLILGCAMSLSSSSECIYVSEISPPNLRGTLVSFNEFGITLGFLLAYCSNVAFMGDMVNGWRWMFGLSSILAIVVVSTAIILPYSPRYLLTKNRVDEAQKIWGKLRQIDLSEEYDEKYHAEWRAMKAHALPVDSVQNTKLCQIQWDNSMMFSFFIGLSLVIMQQSTGQPNLLFYASTVLISFGFQSNKAASMCSVGLGLAKLISSMICIVLIDKFNRRSFLIVGCLMISFSLLFVSSCVLGYQIGVVESCNNVSLQSNYSDNIIEMSSKSNIHIARWFVFFALIVFVTGYSFSFGPITWIILSEIFPTHIRGKAYSFTTTLNWSINLLISLTFLDVSKSSGSVGWPFLLNAIIGFSSVIFIYKFIPETRGKSLEEIQENLKVSGKKYFCLNPN